MNNEMNNNPNFNNMNYNQDNMPNNNINVQNQYVESSTDPKTNEIPTNFESNNNQNNNDSKKNKLPIAIAIIIATILIVTIVLIFTKKINLSSDNETNNKEQNNSNSQVKTTTTKKDARKIKDGYVYTFPSNLFIGDTIPDNTSVFDNYQDFVDLYNRNYFIRNKLEDGYVTESYLGFIYNNKVYYLRGGDNGKYYQESLNTLKLAFGEENCKDYTTQAYTGRASSPAVVCTAPDMFVRAIKDGEVNAGTSQRECSVGYDEFAISHCY